MGCKFGFATLIMLLVGLILRGNAVEFVKKHLTQFYIINLFRSLILGVVTVLNCDTVKKEWFKLNY